MTTLFALIFSLAALASDQDIFEKTYPRDNSFCQIGSKRIEIMVKGFQSHTEPKERMWGENVFARIAGEKPVKWPVTKESGLYRLFQGNPSSCTKTVGTLVGEKFVIFFQKLNSPHKNQLIIQYVDPKTQTPLETVHTPYLSDKASVVKDGVVFRTHPQFRQEIEMGRVTIRGKKFLYQDHVFPIWVKLDQNGFTNDVAETFSDFSYKSFFKSEEDFLLSAGWQEGEKKFTNTKLYVAINHETKSKCIFLTDSKKQLSGEEGWICQ